MYSLKSQDQGLITLSQQDYLPLMVESFLERYSSRVFLDTIPHEASWKHTFFHKRIQLSYFH